MKFRRLLLPERVDQSHPARGAWIEIASNGRTRLSVYASHPARGAWIEIGVRVGHRGVACVAPRKGCVD